MSFNCDLFLLAAVQSTLSSRERTRGPSRVTAARSVSPGQPARAGSNIFTKKHRETAKTE